MEGLTVVADAQPEGGWPQAYMTPIRLILVEDLDTRSKAEKASPTVVEPLWEHIPGDLLERVLLFLPGPCQARFQTVCKRWWQLMSSVKFREKTSSIAFRRSYPTCMVQLGSAAAGDGIKKRFKVREVDVPHIPFHFEGPMVYRGGPAEATVQACWPVFALARCDDMYRPRDLCFRRRRADHTFENLTRIEMGGAGKTVWDVWMVEAAGVPAQMFFSVRPAALPKPKPTTTLPHKGAGSLGAGSRVQFAFYALVVLWVSAAVMGNALSQMLWGGRA